jgi:dual specificity tyrosine-phosphorylation-regulated kinase 2/3/4
MNTAKIFESKISNSPNLNSTESISYLKAGDCFYMNSSSTSTNSLSTSTESPIADFQSARTKPKKKFTKIAQTRYSDWHINTKTHDLRFITPARALLDCFELLSEFEHIEISSFPEIYFLGLGADKVQEPFRNEEGYYKAVKGDHLAYRYEIKELLGTGTFGQVFSCYDHKTSSNVAVKIIRNKKVYRKAGDLENKILQQLARTDPLDINCIVKKQGSFEFRGHLCIIFELLSLNLFQFLHKNDFKGLAVPLVRRIATQLLMAMKTAHSADIIHCDLKPDNILLKHEKKSSIKVIDFGSACQEGNKVFEYVQSRYYRAPEIVIEAPYGKMIDIWSIGCIIVEILTGSPLFPGDSELELFKKHVEVLGMPPKDFASKGKRSKYYINSNGRLKAHVLPGSKKLSEILIGFDDTVINFVENCLKWVPEERITAESGLSHTWIKGAHKPSHM